MIRLKGRHFAAICSGASLFLAAPALAAALSADGVSEPAEIVVTAQRRIERITHTPLAITALAQDFVVRQKLDDINDLVTYAPGFSGKSEGSYIDGLAIRGIVSNDFGIGGDLSIGVFKDGVYQGRIGSVVTSVFDIERAEALRGPQGFLFGRNVISGALSVITNKPSLDGTSGHVYLGYGEPDRSEFEAAVNLPLAEHVAVRFAGYRVHADGWVDNAFTPDRNDRLTKDNKTAARVSLLYDNSPLRIVVSGEHERRRLNGTLYRASNDDREVIDAIDAALGTSLVIGGRNRDVDSDLLDPRDQGTISSINAQADLDLDFATLTSISAYRKYKFRYSEDYDGTPLRLSHFFQQQHGNYLSQELRLVSASGGRLTWSAGISGYREKVRARFAGETDEDIVCRAGFGYDSCDALTADLYGTSYTPSADGILRDVNVARGTNSGVSFYGDLNYQPLPKLEVGAGLRYSHDHKKFALNILPSDSSLGNIWTFTYFTDGFVKDARSWNGLTPRLFARYEASDSVNLYASITRGYKAGGFGSFTVDAPSPIEDYALVPAGTRPDAFAPETIWSEEIGAKGYLFGRALQFDLTAFHYVYRNLQSNFYDTETRTQQVINIGRVHGYGLESAVTLRPSRYFDIYANLTYTKTIKRGERDCVASDCGGLPNPVWASSGVATAHYPMGSDEIYLVGEWNYEGRQRESFDWRGITRRGAYTEVNVRLGYRVGDRWEANVYVQNALNDHFVRGAENGGDLTPATVWNLAQPRNVGLNVRFWFGA